MYQKESPVDPVGAVKVCAIELSPLVAAVLPARAQPAPLWQPAETALTEAPEVVQPVNPLSKPPLVMPEPPPVVPETVRATVVVCDIVPSVPVIVRV